MKNHPILYSFRRCPYAMRARSAIWVSNTAVEIREIDLNNKPGALLSLAPKATVPLLQLIDGSVIGESLDIMNWALVQNDPQKWLGATTHLASCAALISKNDLAFKLQLDRYKYPDRFPKSEQEKARDTGQFFREFDLDICFAVLVSLFDSMAVAPMLSAHWGGSSAIRQVQSWNPFHYLVQGFNRGQTLLEMGYAGFLRRTMKWPLLTIMGVAALSFGLMSTARFLPSGFLPADQSREFNVKVSLPAGYNLDSSYFAAKRVDDFLAQHRYVDYTVLTVGNANQELHKADVFVVLKAKKDRDNLKASEVRDIIRNELAAFKGILKQAQIFVIQTGWSESRSTQDSAQEIIRSMRAREGFSKAAAHLFRVIDAIDPSKAGGVNNLDRWRKF